MQASVSNGGEAAKPKDANADNEANDQDDDTPAGWADVEVSKTVLAVDDPDDGWWEAKNHSFAQEQYWHKYHHYADA